MLMLKGLLAKAASSKQAKLDHERLTSLVNSMADGVLAVDQSAIAIEDQSSISIGQGPIQRRDSLL